MDDITTAIARKFLLDNKADRGNKSANRRLRTLKALWNWHKDTVPRNPWRGIAPFAEEEYIKHVPTPEDVSKVLAVPNRGRKTFSIRCCTQGHERGKSSSFVGLMCPTTAYCYGHKSEKAVQSKADTRQ